MQYICLFGHGLERLGFGKGKSSGAFRLMRLDGWYG